MSEDKNSLKYQWKVFGQLILDPWTLIFLLTTIILCIWVQGQEDETIVAILTFLISLSSGILGGILAKRWDEHNDTTVNRSRAKQAVNSLRLMFWQILTLRNRVDKFLIRNDEERLKMSLPNEINITYLEEIKERTSDLQDYVIKAMSDWEEILPEKDQISDHVSTLSTLMNEYHKKVQNSEDTRNLETEIRESGAKIFSPGSNKIEELFNNSLIKFQVKRNEEGKFIVNKDKQKVVEE